MIPVPDAAERLEAESVLLGLQEELIDTAARRQLLRQKLKKAEEQKDEKLIRETRTDLSKLKDAARFRVELEQFKLRFHSDDPLIQHRIDKLFNDTKKAAEKF
ncbi:MAG: hypothetical protein LBN39_10915, partial [Planctomycetaceae bacterium]|jgi:F0F1-type ATP synthase membrane subunit b/b'|nr:hypothetical protein [Planctomycetaceae bacterium]